MNRGLSAFETYGDMLDGDHSPEAESWRFRRFLLKAAWWIVIGFILAVFWGFIGLTFVSILGGV